MYEKIMVPLDGSDLSECSLEHVKTIALGCKVPAVTLARVVEPLSAQDIAAFAEAGADLINKIEQRSETEASDYLEHISARLKSEGLNNQTALLHGQAADSILDYAAKNSADLIIMTTHGRSGISRWLMGSVADRVIRSSAVPVLIVSPPGCRITKSAK